VIGWLFGLGWLFGGCVVDDVSRLTIKVLWEGAYIDHSSTP
jgi:hypothetical protein